MSSDTITLELDKYESGVVFHSLKDKRNQMLKEGKDTELVDDVLMKVIEKIEVPSIILSRFLVPISFLFHLLPCYKFYNLK